MTLNIMIVEDEPIIAMDLEDVLLEAGYRIVGIADNMHNALDIAQAKRVDVAIMDIDLAFGTNGIETARHLRERHNVGSLFVSARLTDQVRAMALEWGPVGFVEKPFRSREIINALRSSPV